MHVTAVVRDQAGMAEDPRGAAAATCKIAGIAYTGSNPVPTTSVLTSNNAVVGRPIRSGSRAEFPSARRGADTDCVARAASLHPTDPW
jgi:hypothetical protein